MNKTNRRNKMSKKMKYFFVTLAYIGVVVFILGVCQVITYGTFIGAGATAVAIAVIYFSTNKKI